MRKLYIYIIRILTTTSETLQKWQLELPGIISSTRVTPAGLILRTALNKLRALALFIRGNSSNFSAALYFTVLLILSVVHTHDLWTLQCRMEIKVLLAETFASSGALSTVIDAQMRPDLWPGEPKTLWPWVSAVLFLASPQLFNVLVWAGVPWVDALQITVEAMHVLGAWFLAQFSEVAPIVVFRLPAEAAEPSFAVEIGTFSLTDAALILRVPVEEILSIVSTTFGERGLWLEAPRSWSFAAFLEDTLKADWELVKEKLWFLGTHEEQCYALAYMQLCANQGEHLLAAINACDEILQNNSVDGAKKLQDALQKYVLERRKEALLLSCEPARFRRGGDLADVDAWLDIARERNLVSSLKLKARLSEVVDYLSE